MPKYVITVEVTGPRSFLLFAVWTKTDQEHCYVEAAVRAVYLYRKLIASGPAVFIGDVKTSLDTLPGDLSRKLTQDDPTLPPTQQRVYIRADKTVRYGDFMSVMNTLQGNGFYQVALINEEI